MSNTLFRKTSLDSISSPEQLNDYIKVSTPSIWIVLVSLFILLAAVFVWGVAGNLPTTVNVQGVALDGHVICFVKTEDAANIKIDQVAIISGSGDAELKGHVFSIGNIPMSAAEITSEIKSDYLIQALVGGGYAVKVTIMPDSSVFTGSALLNVSIVTESVRPIDFLLD